MKILLITSIGILILMVSCKKIETQKADIPKQKPKSELKSKPKKKINKITKPEHYFAKDSLRNLLESELDKIALSPLFKIKAEPKINTHSKKITDTIKILTFEENKICIYRSLDKEWISFAKIRSSKFKFLDSVKIGVRKQTLEYILKSKLESDLIKIGDVENTSAFIFTFSNDKLKSIDYKGYVD